MQCQAAPVLSNYHFGVSSLPTGPQVERAEGGGAARYTTIASTEAVAKAVCRQARRQTVGGIS